MKYLLTLYGIGHAGAQARARPRARAGSLLPRFGAAGGELARRVGLGDAVATTGGDLPARWVIHAATMELGGPTSADIIERATRSTLAKAEELGCRSLALVAFGTGVGGFPLEECARIMVDAVRAYEPSALKRVVFAVFGADAKAAFVAALES